MRLNFTGRRKIDKQHVRVAFRDDPPGSGRGHYFDLTLDLTPYKLPAGARVFVEAARGLTLMRFDFGTVAVRASLTPAQRRLAEFGPDPDGVRFRLKVTQPDGPEAGKLLAEADGIRPEDDGGVSPLIYIVGTNEGTAPWRLELVPTDVDLPTLHLHTDIGGKDLARDPVAKPLLLTAVAREVFTALVWAGDPDEENDEHWLTRWTRFAKDVLGLPDPPDDEDDAAIREWVESAVDAFAEKQALVEGLAQHKKAELELQSLEEIN